MTVRPLKLGSVAVIRCVSCGASFEVGVVWWRPVPLAEDDFDVPVAILCPICNESTVLEVDRWRYDHEV